MDGVDEFTVENGTVCLGSECMPSDEFRTFVRHSLYLLDVEPQNIAIVTLYIPVFLVAAISNILVIIVIYRFQHLRSVTNYFLVNLSVADLMVTFICMPMAMSTSITANWFYGLLMCKFTTFFQGVAASSSVFSILAMSMDRYVAIKHPIVFRQFFSKRVARCVIVIIWIVAALLFVPLLLVRTTVVPSFLQSLDVSIGSDVYYCTEIWGDEWYRRTYGVCLFAAVYAVPCTLVLTAYISMSCKLCAPSVMKNHDGSDLNLDRDSRLLRCRRRVARTLLVLAFLFAVCWMPYNFLNLIIDHFDQDTQQIINIKVTPFMLWLGHANSAANPLLYCLLSRNIRQSLWCLFRKNQNPRSSSEQPLALNGIRCRLNRKLSVPTESHNRRPEAPKFKNLLVMDGLSPVTLPLKKKHQEITSSFLKLPAEIGSVDKLVHTKGFLIDINNQLVSFSTFKRSQSI